MGMMTLVEEGTGRQLVASQLAGLNLPAQPHLGNYATPFSKPYGGPPAGPGGYPAGYAYQPQTDTGSSDIATSYAFSIFGLVLGFCGWFFAMIAIGGIVFANYAGQKGNRGAPVARIFAILALVIPLGFHVLAASGFFSRASE